VFPVDCRQLGSTPDCMGIGILSTNFPSAENESLAETYSAGPCSDIVLQ
jgi:hypothetical protein